MDRQDTENLFRRFKGQIVNIKTVSMAIYEGRITEVTNDYVSLSERETTKQSQVFIFFPAIESLTIVENKST